MMPRCFTIWNKTPPTAFKPSTRHAQYQQTQAHSCSTATDIDPFHTRTHGLCLNWNQNKQKLILFFFKNTVQSVWTDNSVADFQTTVYLCAQHTVTQVIHGSTSAHGPCQSFLCGRTLVIHAKGPRLHRSSFYSWFHTARWETRDANVAVASRVNRKFTAAFVSSRCASLQTYRWPSIMWWIRWPPSLPLSCPGIKLVHFHARWHGNK